MLSFFAPIVLLSSVAVGGVALAEEITGRATVLDGDTLRIGEKRVRLSGIDAPETDQSCIDASGKRWLCGIAARDRLSTLIANQPVLCEISGIDGYDRRLASCAVGKENINRVLVREGLALAYTKYSQEFVEDEKLARTSKRGFWAGTFIAPWDWRARTSSTPILGHHTSGASLNIIFASQDTPPNPDCLIKGNINKKGDRIFHMQGQRDYARVKMKSSAKRWFCTEEEALAAGWLKAKR